MKVLTLIGISIFLSVSFFLHGSAFGQTKTDSILFHGRVYDKDSINKSVFASVILYSENGDTIAKTISNKETGKYSLKCKKQQKYVFYADPIKKGDYLIQGETFIVPDNLIEKKFDFDMTRIIIMK